MMKQKVFFSGVITLLTGAVIYFAYQARLLKDCTDEEKKLKEEKVLYLKSIFMMDKLLEAEDLFSEKKVAESLNIINEIDGQLLTSRAQGWLDDLEGRIRRKGKL